MIDITKNKDEIVVREISVRQWLNSFIIAAILFVAAFFGIVTLTDSSTLAWILGTTISVTGLLLYLLDNPSTTIKINKKGETVSVRKQSPLRYTFNIYSFNEIADLIYVNEHKDSGLQTNYQIVMPLKNGQKIELSGSMRMNATEYFDAADSMNFYVFDVSKQISAKATAWSLKKIDD